MAFQVSPGINVSEIDLTSSVPGVSVSTGAIAGAFKWGPALEPTSVSSETELVSTFGAPDNDTANVFFTAASFLAYSNDLYVVRAVNATTTKNAVASANSRVNTSVSVTGTADINGTTVVLGSGTAFDSELVSGDFITINSNTRTVNVVTNAAHLTVTTAFSQTLSAQTFTALRSVGQTTAGILVENSSEYFTGEYTGTAAANVAFIARYAGDKGNSLLVSICPSSGAFTTWTAAYKNLFDSAPGTSDYADGKGGSNDEMHIVVVDAGGLFTGTPGTVVEKFGYVSKGSDARNDDGSTNYYKEVLFNKSKYIYWANHPANTANGTNTSNWGSTVLNTTFGAGNNYTSRFGQGADGSISTGQLQTAYALYNDKENIDISLVISADGHDKGIAGNLFDLADSRKDCVAFISPTFVDTFETDPAVSIAGTATALSTRNSYGVHDSGWKYMYDKYNDKYRWVPLNGDIAGLCARTDRDRDPWFSPAGFARGAIRNVVKLAFNPNQTDRDTLYKAGVNPVVSLPGEGTLLFGDKTLSIKPSAFDRINVRRLFIVLEKAISRAARASLFEFNDEFTRAQFVSLVEPFLRTVQGRRGIYDFRVVCDETNNTADIIDRNEFVGDIYIKPARSINFVQLNFVAVRTGVEFQEIVGRF